MAIVAVVPRQHGVDRIHQVVVATGSGLHHRNSCGRMRNEDVEQAVTLSCDESNSIGCEIENTSPVSGLDRKGLSVHGFASDVLALEDLTH